MLARVVATLAIATCGACQEEGFGSENGHGTDTGGESDGATSQQGSTGADPGPTTGVSQDCSDDIASIASTIFQPGCATNGCHRGTAPAGDLDLSSNDPSESLVGVPSSACMGEILVVPGDPEASLLYAKLIDAQTCGTPMPPGDPLDDAMVTCIRNWIAGTETTCETCGGDTCVPLQSDPANCGACGDGCPAEASCVEAQCVCPDGSTMCDGSCVNTRANPDHCGGCGTSCSKTQVCNMGACSDDCGTLSVCAGGCVDLMTDPDNCGGCGRTCGSGQACVDGSCGCEGEEISYAAAIEPFIVSECTTMSCHNGVAPSAGLDLTTGQGYGDMVDVPSEQCANRLLVSPGAPQDSYLLDKVLGTNLCFGSKMPKQGAGLPAADIDAITAWICGGAAP